MPENEKPPYDKRDTPADVTSSRKLMEGATGFQRISSSNNSLALRLMCCWYLCLAPSGVAFGLGQPIILNFDELDASYDDPEGHGGRREATSYLARYGITISGKTDGTMIAIFDTSNLYQGEVLVTTSLRNVLTQLKGCDLFFTLNLPGLMQMVSFTRPKLLAGVTGIVFPGWEAQALDEAGKILETVGDPLGISSYSNVPARTFVLRGPGIKAVRFHSTTNNAAFQAVLIDDLTLYPPGSLP